MSRPMAVCSSLVVSGTRDNEDIYSIIELARRRFTCRGLDKSSAYNMNYLVLAQRGKTGK